MAATFLQLLLTVLVEKRVDLLRDEIVQTIFQMATVDLAWFHSSFLPGFLLSVQGVPDMNKTEIMNGVRVLEVSDHVHGGSRTNVYTDHFIALRRTRRRLLTKSAA